MALSQDLPGVLKLTASSLISFPSTRSTSKAFNKDAMALISEPGFLFYFTFYKKRSFTSLPPSPQDPLRVGQIMLASVLVFFGALGVEGDLEADITSAVLPILTNYSLLSSMEHNRSGWAFAYRDADISFELAVGGQYRFPK